MKQARTALLFICTTLLVVLLMLPSAVQASESIKIVSWNIGAFTIEREYWDMRVDYVVHWLGKNDFDIIALQETHYGRKEGERIAARLEELGYGKFYVSKALDPKSDTDERRGGPGVYVLSKFPIKYTDDSFKGKSTNRSMLAVIELPHYGDVSIVSTHPSADSRCREPVALLSAVNGLPAEMKEKIIVMGDMNSTIINIDKNADVKALKGDICGVTVLISKFTQNCTNMKECARPTNLIDWIFTPAISKIPIDSKRSHGEIYGTLGIPGSSWKDDFHPPISAVILLPTPPRKPADLDANGAVDIFDYDVLLGKFGATGAPGFHPADIIQNGAVDIFDYNKLIENFGK